MFYVTIAICEKNYSIIGLRELPFIVDVRWGPRTSYFDPLPLENSYLLNYKFFLLGRLCPFRHGMTCRLSLCFGRSFMAWPLLVNGRIQATAFHESLAGVKKANDEGLPGIFNTESASQGLKNSPFFRKRPKTLNPEMVEKKKKKYLRIHRLVLNPNV